MLAIETSLSKSERFLVELEFPLVRVTLGSQEHLKDLNEDDLKYLVASKFQSWKSFVMTRHFRLELNIGQEEPLPNIKEEEKGEDEDQRTSEVDLRELYPATLEEQQQIEQTRSKLTAWFPI